MNGISHLERRVIVALAKAQNGLDVFSLYSKYQCSPAALLKVAKKLDERGFIQIRDSRLSMTTKGREWAMTTGGLSTPVEAKTWRAIPIEFQQPKLPINKPYVPRLSLVDINILPPGWKRDRK
jgi:hypothetical protein